MLVGAEIVEATVDDDGGMAVFVNPVDLKKRGGDWIAAGYAQLIRGEIASLLCRDIPPGEKRVIDLEKSVIVHVAPKKTAVEELVEKLDVAFKGVCRDDLRITGSVGIDNKKAGDVFDALARVRQEGGV